MFVLLQHRIGYIISFSHLCNLPISYKKLSKTANFSRWIKRWTMEYLAN